MSEATIEIGDNVLIIRYTAMGLDGSDIKHLEGFQYEDEATECKAWVDALYSLIEALGGPTFNDYHIRADVVDSKGNTLKFSRDYNVSDLP